MIMTCAPPRGHLLPGEWAAELHANAQHREPVRGHARDAEARGFSVAGEDHGLGVRRPDFVERPEAALEIEQVGERDVVAGAGAVIHERDQAPSLAYGSGANSTPSATLNIAVVAPIPDGEHADDRRR